MSKFDKLMYSDSRIDTLTKKERKEYDKYMRENKLEIVNMVDVSDEDVEKLIDAFIEMFFIALDLNRRKLNHS